MNVQYCEKQSFAVIGKEGSTEDGKGFIQKLWNDANGHFNEVEALARRNADGSLCGIWGAMSDFGRSFKPWENNFTKGLYLAGVECEMNAEAPDGWSKWIIPACMFLYVELTAEDTFSNTLEYMEQKGIPLAGAVQEFTCPQTGKNYLFFPVKRC